MKSKKITPVFIVALLLISSSFKLLAQPLNGVYAVGGTGSDFSDIYTACAALSSRGVSGPVEFNFSSGVTNCTATIALGNITGASLTNTITFNGNGHAIRSNVSPIIKIDGGGYLAFDRFDIAGAANFVGIAFWIINGSHDIAINSCVINVGITSASQGSACISTSQDPNAVNAGAHNIRRLKITNNQVIGGWACITVLNLITSDSNQSHIISNNKIEDFYCCGIYAHSGDLMEVNNNDISRPDRQNSHAMVYGVYFLGARTLRFNNNNIHHTGAGAYSVVALYHLLHDDAGYLTSEITNNTISNINTTGSISGFTFEQPMAYGVHIDSLKFYHNTIALNLPVGSTGEIRAVNISSVPTTTTALIKNNILSISGNGSGNKYLVAKTSAVTLKSNYNLFNLAVTGGNNYIGFTGFSFHVDLNSWKSSAMDVNSISADPFFANIDCVNLVPLSGAGMNAGAGVGVLTDKNGAVRSVSGPDIGAFEGDSVINDLALVSAGIKPSNTCYSDTVFFTVRNAKGAAIDLSVTPVMLYWEVNGPSSSNGMLYISAGTLAAGSNATFFDHSLYRPYPGTYTLKAYLQPGGINTAPTNDTLCSCVTSVLPNALSVSPKLFTINNSRDSVMITANSLLFPVTSGFDWSTNGNSFSTNRQIYAGPYTSSGIYKYTARLIHNCHYYSDTVTIIAGSGVPVKLMAFSAKPHHEDVDLKWETAHEKNVAYFEIHRSGGNNEWEPIAKIEATGNSNSIKAYVFKDGAAMKRSVSRLYYKLKSVDHDGAFEWSDETIVSLIHDEARPAIYPNPFNGEFTVSVPSDGKARVTISSLQGETLFTTDIEPVNHKIRLRNIDHLYQGIYLLKVTTDGVTYTGKLVKN